MIARQPIGVPGADIHSIGAGGGSIGWIDSGGALRVGPQSAGAKPGPAAYGNGGVEPTVTDANIVLGYLSPEAFLGGRRRLRSDLAEQAVRERIAEPLGLDVARAAAGFVRVVNENMVNAIGVVSLQRGIDPRPFLLVAGGGAGALHAGRLAAELGIERVLIPVEAGVISAYGMTVTDVRYDYARTLHTSSPDPAIDDVRRLLVSLETDALRDLARSGFLDDRVLLQRFVDARYVGQVHELMVPVPAGELHRADFETIAGTFHSLHHQRYGWSAREYSVEYLHWRVTGTGIIERPAEFDFGSISAVLTPDAARRTRLAYFEELGGMVDVPTFWSNEVQPGAEVFGPALIDGTTTTIVVFPGQRLLADGKGSYLIETGVKHGRNVAGKPDGVREGRVPGSDMTYATFQPWPEPSARRHRSFWLEQALITEPDAENTAQRLEGQQHADVCIVGGGYTGLWTAIRLKELDPVLDVTIVEADICGAGASGRNGGIAVGWLWRIPTLLGFCGGEDTARLVRASISGIDDIETVCREEGIDAHFKREGWYWTATNRAQIGAWQKALETADALGLEVMRVVQHEDLIPASGIKDARRRGLGYERRHHSACTACSRSASSGAAARCSHFREVPGAACQKGGSVPAFTHGLVPLMQNGSCLRQTLGWYTSEPSGGVSFRYRAT